MWNAAVIALACSTVLWNTVSHGAIVQHDFSGTAGTQPTGWTPGAGDSWALDGAGKYRVVTTTTASGATANANTQIIDVSQFQVVDRVANTAFSLSATFNVVAVTGSSSWNLGTGIRFLASSTPVEGSGAYYNLFAYRDNAVSRLDLTKTGGTGSLAGTTTVSTPFGTPVASPSVNYTLSVSGTYVGSTLSLAYSLTNGTTTWSGTATDANPLGGDSFGLRQRARNFTGAAGLSMTTDYDEYTMTYEASAVPEPMAGAFAVMASLLALRHRRNA